MLHRYRPGRDSKSGCGEVRVYRRAEDTFMALEAVCVFCVSLNPPCPKYDMHCQGY